MPLPKIDTSNPNHIVYDNPLVKFTLLGGIKIDGLDRMRATLKAERPKSPKPPIRHNVDLYNDTQCEKLIRKIAERLDLGTNVISAGLADLIAQLENYRLEKIKEQEVETDLKKVLTKEEEEEALSFLTSPNLLKNTSQLLAKSGIIGEQSNALILYLAMTSRKCNDPLSVICLAKSGEGKSYLMEKVAACMPSHELLENTQFSENSFYYYKREEIRGKVFLIEDLDGAQAVLYPIRELQSKKKISKTVTVKDKNGVNRSTTLVVEGPVSVIGCTTKERIYEDNANRSILIYLDHSKEQDKKILAYQKEQKANLIDKQQERYIQSKLQDVQSVLEPVKIVNPYALLIDLPKEIFKPRRTMSLLLNFIEAITYYHQKQREEQVIKETGEVFIETTPEDIELSFELLKETLFRKSDELSGAIRNFYEWLTTLKLEKFTASILRVKRSMPPRTLQRYLRELHEYDYIERVGGNQQKGYEYQLNKKSPSTNLEEKISKQIDKVLESVRQCANVRQSDIGVQK